MDTKKEYGFGPMTRLFQKTDLDPKFILALKALLIYILVIYRGIFLDPFDKFPFLPFVPFLDHIPSMFYTIAIAILFLSIISVLLKKGNYRILSLLSGFIILSLILSSKTFFSNSLTFVACLLILIGLYRDSTYIFRIQIALLYIGAAANKMVDPDWWNGYYFDFFLRDIFNVALYQSIIPDGNLLVAKGLGIATIFIESFLGIAVLIPRITRLTILIGLSFHFVMLAVTSGQLSVLFFFIMSAAFLLISDIKFKPIHIYHHSSFTLRLVSFFDLSESFIFKKRENQSFSVIINNHTYTRYKGMVRIICSPQSLASVFFIAILYDRIDVVLKKMIISVFPFL